MQYSEKLDILYRSPPEVASLRKWLEEVKQKHATEQARKTAETR